MFQCYIYIINTEVNWCRLHLMDIALRLCRFQGIWISIEVNIERIRNVRTSSEEISFAHPFFFYAMARYFLQSLPSFIALLLKLRCYFKQSEITFIYIEICIFEFAFGITANLTEKYIVSESADYIFDTFHALTKVGP